MPSLDFKTRDFVHLHLHSDYSLLQSTIQLKPLVKTLTKFGSKACAITDNGNMYGAVSFYRAMKAAQIRPVIGYEANFTLESIHDDELTRSTGHRPYYSLVLLAKNSTGYQNLVHLSSKAFTEGFKHKPRIDKELLASHSEGLVALSAGMDGLIWDLLRSDEKEKAKAQAAEFAEIFGKDGFYLEVQDHGIAEERQIVKGMLELSKGLDIPIV